MRLATAAQMRECDRLTIEGLGLPGIALMESAGRGATAALLDAIEAHGMGSGQSVGVFCGSGNNGGDGFVIARELLYLGYPVRVYLLGRREGYSGDAEINLQVLERIIDQGLAPGAGTLDYWGDSLQAGTSIEALLGKGQPHEILVDALLGTGLSKPVRSPIAEVIAHISGSSALVLAVDIPSGLSSDTGQPLGACVNADLTATFGLAKLGQVLYPGRQHCGSLHVIDIGIPPGIHDRAGINAEALTAEIVSEVLPGRIVTGHKGTFGHVLALGGATGKVGALMLCAKAAMRTGAGLVTAAGSTMALTQVSTAYPEVMTVAILPDSDEVRPPVGRLGEAAAGKIVAAGPGLGTSAVARELVQHLLLRCTSPLVLDADALNIIAAADSVDKRMMLRAASSHLPVVLTPHPGEFARLTGLSTSEILADTVGSARQFATETGCIVVLKIASTVVAHPDGRAAINTSGNPGMGTGGSGDVLTGIIAALLAQGLGAWDAARAGVFIHGMSGDLAAERHGERSLVAGDLIEHLGEAFQRCEMS